MASNFEASPNPVSANSQVYPIVIPPLFSAAEAVGVKEKVEELCQQKGSVTSGVTSIVLDFSATTFMDSSGIGALVRCHTLAQNRGIELRLVQVAPTVMMALSLTELDQVLTIDTVTPNQQRSLPAASQGTENVVVMTHPSVHSKAKRLIDIAGAFVGLSFLALILPFVVIAIKFDDGGPIFFGQVRCSWLGRRFRMWKFRSMILNAEALKHTVENKAQGALFKNPNDPRITRVGRFLRRTSLDEFPQFWNVLRGEMSLVGTRPPTPDELERYEILQWSRLDIKPGITGEWQVNGRSNVSDFEDVVRLDLKYQENWSLSYDIKLLIKTVLLLFHKDSGSY
ncbi:sugar transferase [Prochlorothrix hollandica]|uniref:sugar transferase n=1 Tax=Prochlorothrix hollandica TaxID=1223 RepID=UPI0003466DA6|nr:sugar transferase [Prochlorothrix hollandica]